MNDGSTVISRHFLRRTARWSEKRMEKKDPGNQYKVHKLTRGPYRYVVLRRG
jgi:hypothetical protein